jgi:hypothetical protein
MKIKKRKRFYHPHKPLTTEAIPTARFVWPEKKCKPPATEVPPPSNPPKLTLADLDDRFCVPTRKSILAVRRPNGKLAVTTRLRPGDECLGRCDPGPSQRAAYAAAKLQFGGLV